MGQKKPPTVADMVVTVPFGGFAADRGTLGDRAADVAEYPGLPTDAYYPTSRPGPALRPSRTPAPPKPPLVSVASLLQMPSAALGAAMGSMIGQAPEVGTTRRLREAVPAAARAAFHAPFQETPTSPAQEAAKRGLSEFEGLPGLAFDILSDPTNLIGGDPISDVGKIAAVAGPGAVKGLSRLYSRLVEEVLPRLSKSQHPNKVRSVLKSFASSDEVAATGLEDFLASKGDKPVTLEEVQAHLAGNKFEMRETVRGQGDPKLAEASLQQDKLQRTVISPMAVWADTLDEEHPFRTLLDDMQEGPPGGLVDVERGWEPIIEKYEGLADAPLLQKIKVFRLPDGSISTSGPPIASRPISVEMYKDLSTGQLHDPEAAGVMTANDTGMGAVVIPDNILRQFPGSKTVGDLARNFGRVLEESERVGGIGLDAVPTFAGPPKYERYTLPGDKRDYREVLIQMPEAKVAPLATRITREVKDAATPVAEKLIAHYQGFRGYAPSGILENVIGAGREASPISAFKDIDKWVGDGAISAVEGDLLKNYAENSRLDQTDKQRLVSGPRFKSSHWSEPDIVTHMRYDTRRVGEGDALFVEEIQSDWDQAGREKGYADPAKERELKAQVQAAQDEYVAARDALFEDPELAVYKNYDGSQRDNVAVGVAMRVPQGSRGPTFSPALVERANALKALGDKSSQLQEDLRQAQRGVADQPFKGTKATELGVKRALLEAVDQGLDQVAWTTGKQQAQRYNRLLQDVQEVVWEPTLSEGAKPGDGTLRAGGHNIEVNKKELHQYIGRENAERLLAARHRPTYNASQLLAEPERYDGEFEFLSKATMDRLQTNYVNARQFIDFRTGKVKKPAFTITPEFSRQTSGRHGGDRDWWGMDLRQFDVPETLPWQQLYESEADAKKAADAWLESRQHLGLEHYRLDTSENPLTIGSRGMNQQYDETMVSQFNRLGKPYGAKAELVPMADVGTGSQHLQMFDQARVRHMNQDPAPYVAYGEDDMGYFIEVDMDAEVFEALEESDPHSILAVVSKVYKNRGAAQSAMEKLVQKLKLAKSEPPSPHRRTVEGAVVEPYNSRESEVMLEHPTEDDAGVSVLQDFEGFRVRIDDEAELWDAMEAGDIESNVFDRHLNRAFRTREEAVKALNKMKAEAKRLWPAEEPEKVWRFSIPQKMRDDLATRGLPLMAVAPVGLDEETSLEDRAALAGLGVLAVVLGGKFGKGRQPAMQRMLDDLAKTPANVSRAAKKAGLTGTLEENALALYKMRSGGEESHTGMWQAMKDAGVPLPPVKTANEKQLANAYVREMLKRAATPAGPAEGPFAGKAAASSPAASLYGTRQFRVEAGESGGMKGWHLKDERGESFDFFLTEHQARTEAARLAKQPYIGGIDDALEQMGARLAPPGPPRAGGQPAPPSAEGPFAALEKKPKGPRTYTSPEPYTKGERVWVTAKGQHSGGVGQVVEDHGDGWLTVNVGGEIKKIGSDRLQHAVTDKDLDALFREQRQNMRPRAGRAELGEVEGRFYSEFGGDELLMDMLADAAGQPAIAKLIDRIQDDGFATKKELEAAVDELLGKLRKYAKPGRRAVKHLE